LIILIILAVFLAGIGLSSAWTEGNDHRYQTVSFPSVNLKTEQGKGLTQLRDRNNLVSSEPISAGAM
jgi:hypothetical protein